MTTTIPTFTSTTSTRPMMAVAKEAVAGTALLEASYGGKVQFFKVRETGTSRRWPVLAPKSPERKQAEAIKAEVASGTVSDVAAKHKVSIATLRRTLTALAFTEELEGMTVKERAALAKTVNVVKTAPKAEEKKPAAKPEAPKGQPSTEQKDKAIATSGVVKFPNATTMRKRVVESGSHTEEEAAALTPKDLKVQFALLGDK